MKGSIFTVVIASVVVTAYSDSMTPKVVAMKLAVSSIPTLNFHKVLARVVNEPSQIYADDLGNAIIFARVYANKTSRTMTDNSDAKKTRVVVNLGYSTYRSSNNKWSEQKAFHYANTDSMASIKSYQLLNYNSKSNQVLFYTSSTDKPKGHKPKLKEVKTSLWSVRKEGVLGSWGIAHKIITTTNAILFRLSKSCSIRICVVAWQDNVNSKTRAVTKNQNVIHFKSLKIRKTSDLRWSVRKQVRISTNHNILQYKMVVLDSSNLALVWLAAVQSGRKKNSEKVQLKIFVRMRINDRWGTSKVVAILGNNGVAEKLGEFTVKANRQRQMLITWSEYLSTVEFKAIVYNKKWRSATVIYKDNPEVRKIFTYMSASGKIVVYWQQKYGQYSHVFSSELSLRNNKWSIPKKIDKGPQVAALQSGRTRDSEVVLMWLKNFKVMELVLFDNKSIKKKKLRLQRNIEKGFSLPAIELFNNRVLKVSWTKSVKSGFEVWVQDVHFSQKPGRR